MTAGVQHFVRPDSALARAAADLLDRHTAGDPEGGCVSCGQPSPCASARNAAEVRRATGFVVAVKGSTGRGPASVMSLSQRTGPDAEAQPPVPPVVEPVVVAEVEAAPVTDDPDVPA